MCTLVPWPQIMQSRALTAESALTCARVLSGRCCAADTISATGNGKIGVARERHLYHARFEHI